MMKNHVARKSALVALLVVLSAFLLCPPSHGQPARQRVAIFTPGLTFAPILQGLQEGLSRLGYEDGRNITYIVDDTKGMTHDLAARAAKLVAARPDVIVTVTTMHTRAAKAATNTVPIVFTWANDPVASLLTAGYGSSKNNLTGVTSFDGPLSGKRLEVLLEMSHKVKRLLVPLPPWESNARISLPFLEQTAKKLGLQLVRRVVASRQEMEKTLAALPKGSVDGIYYLPSELLRVNADLLVRKALADRIPLAAQEDTLVEIGALFSYGPSIRMVGVQTAALVDKVLKGARPDEIVVETPSRLFLALNLATAEEIGLKVPRGILERADRLVR